jgi:hypothetical protein
MENTYYLSIPVKKKAESERVLLSGDCCFLVIILAKMQIMFADVFTCM